MNSDSIKQLYFSIPTLINNHMIVSDVVILVSIPDFDLTVSILLTVLVADYLIHVGHLLQMLPSASAYSAVVHFVIPKPLLIFSNIAWSSTLAIISSNSSFNSSHIAS